LTQNEYNQLSIKSFKWNKTILLDKLLKRKNFFEKEGKGIKIKSANCISKIIET